jgi:uncharacterized protein (TIGR00251 family)
VSLSERQAKISLRVFPNAARNEVAGFTDGVLRVKIAAPPVEGKANKELIALLARKLGLSKGDLTIIKGYTSRNKVIVINGLSQEEITRRLLLG